VPERLRAAEPGARGGWRRWVMMGRPKANPTEARGRRARLRQNALDHRVGLWFSVTGERSTQSSGRRLLFVSLDRIWMIPSISRTGGRWASPGNSTPGCQTRVHDDPIPGRRYSIAGRAWGSSFFCPFRSDLLNRPDLLCSRSDLERYAWPRLHF
jgi:hypothetical protein